MVQEEKEKVSVEKENKKRQKGKRRRKCRRRAGKEGERIQGRKGMKWKAASAFLDGKFISVFLVMRLQENFFPLLFDLFHRSTTL